MEAMDGPGDVLAPTLIVKFGKGSGVKPHGKVARLPCKKKGILSMQQRSSAGTAEAGGRRRQSKALCHCTAAGSRARG